MANAVIMYNLIRVHRVANNSAYQIKLLDDVYIYICICLSLFSDCNTIFIINPCIATMVGCYGKKKKKSGTKKKIQI